MKNVLVAGLLVAMLLTSTVMAGGLTFGREKLKGTSKTTGDFNLQQRHPNLDQAQKLVQQACARVTAAQTANEYDLAGHAAKAKEHLALALQELAAATAAAPTPAPTPAAAPRR
jgi:hypothetical protein